MNTVLPSRFGWVGLGAMGWPMANQLLKNTSARLVIYDVDESLLPRFAREALDPTRVEIAANARQVTDSSDCIVTIVPAGQHVKEVYLTPVTGLLAGTVSGKTFIDCSTIDIETSLAIGEAVMASDPRDLAHFIDCPVSGGTAGAANGTITFMVGMAADDPRFPSTQAILSTMGNSVTAMGGKGLGLAAKLSNNYLSGIIALATSEAMSIGMTLGIDSKVLSATFEKGTGANWVNKSMNPVPGVCPDAATSKGYEGGFKVQLMEKDMKLAAAAARQAGVKLVLADTAISAYSSAASDPRYRNRDSRVVYQWLHDADLE